MGPSSRSPNTRRVYLNGVTDDMEPVRIAFINAEYAKTPATTAAIKPMQFAL